MIKLIVVTNRSIGDFFEVEQLVDRAATCHDVVHVDLPCLKEERSDY